jgi:hypothetical protein
MACFYYKYKHVLVIFRRQFLISLLPLMFLYHWQGDWKTYLIGVAVVLLPHLFFALLYRYLDRQAQREQDIFQASKVKFVAFRLMTMHFVRLLLIILGIIIVFAYILHETNTLYFILGLIVAAIAYVIAGFKQYYTVGE